MPPNASLHTTPPGLLRRLLRDIRGATAIEYALIAALIALVIIGAVTTLGTSLSDAFTGIANAL